MFTKPQLKSFAMAVTKTTAREMFKTKVLLLGDSETRRMSSGLFVN